MQVYFLGPHTLETLIQFEVIHKHGLGKSLVAKYRLINSSQSVSKQYARKNGTILRLLLSRHAYATSYTSRPPLTSGPKNKIQMKESVEVLSVSWISNCMVNKAHPLANIHVVTCMCAL